MALSLKPPDYVVVDDNDPLLTYSPSNWTSYTAGGLNDVGDWGPPYRQTLHRITGDGSLSFSFNGTFINAFASFNNTAEGSNPEWKCIVDGNIIAKMGSPVRPNNNWEICNSAGTQLGPGVHNFTLEVTGVGNHTGFWFDWISYRPPDGYVVIEGTVYYSPEALDVQYIGEWQQWTPYNQIGAATAGSSAVLCYRGVSVSWYGFLWGVPTPSIGNGVYTIDGGSPVSFTWESRKNQSTYRHLFFKTPDVPLGPHFLNVTFLGSSPELTPLSFTRFYVDIRSDITATMTPAINLNRLSAIYGGVLGAVVAIFLFGAIACVIIWKRRHERRWKKNPASEQQPTEIAANEDSESPASHNSDMELGNHSGLAQKDEPVPSCEGERHQEIQMSLGPFPSSAVS